MTSAPIRAAVIGTGGISRGEHIPALAALAPRVEVGAGRRAEAVSHG